MTLNLNATAEAALNVLQHHKVLEFGQGNWRVVTLEVAIEYVVSAHSQDANGDDPQDWLNQFGQCPFNVPMNYVGQVGLTLQQWQEIFKVNDATFVTVDIAKNFARALTAFWIQQRIHTGGYWIDMLELSRQRAANSEAILLAAATA